MPKDDLPAPQSGVSRQAGGQAPPQIDILHRILWLVENEPRKLNRFLDEARPDRERLRLVAQALAGTAPEGDNGREMVPEVVGGRTTPHEQRALQKLVANWKMLTEKGRMFLFQK